MEKELFYPAHKFASSKQVRVSSNGLQSPLEAESLVVVRAKEVQSSLDPKFPSFIKEMLKSHVCRGFWMAVPTQFCKSHLPKDDMLVTLQNEMGAKFEMRYIAYKLGLSGGWKDFAIAHNLLVGDVVIFHLVESTRFKVYIVRANDLDEVDGAVSPQNDTVMSSDEDRAQNCQKALSQNIMKRKRSQSLRCACIQKSKKTGSVKSVPRKSQLKKIYEKSDRGTDMPIIVSPISSSSPVQFRDVKSFEDFTIVVDEVCIDSELPDHIRAKYYTLCSVRKSFLHAHLIEGLNSKLIAGIICEIVYIAESLKHSSLTTSRKEFSNWEKALKSFQLVGMSVQFLLARIQKLVKFAFDSEGASASRKYMQAILDRVRMEDKMMKIESKFVELEETHKKCDKDVAALKSKAESYEHKFREEVDAPW